MRLRIKNSFCSNSGKFLYNFEIDMSLLARIALLAVVFVDLIGQGLVFPIINELIMSAHLDFFTYCNFDGRTSLLLWSVYRHILPCLVFLVRYTLPSYPIVLAEKRGLLFVYSALLLGTY